MIETEPCKPQFSDFKLTISEMRELAKSNNQALNALSKPAKIQLLHSALRETKRKVYKNG